MIGYTVTTSSTLGLFFVLPLFQVGMALKTTSMDTLSRGSYSRGGGLILYTDNLDLEKNIYSKISKYHYLRLTFFL